MEKNNEKIKNNNYLSEFEKTSYCDDCKIGKPKTVLMLS
jgi:hypothetical protein